MRKINEGYCAEIFETEDHKILKLYKPGWDCAEVRQEYTNTRIINELGLPSPKVYETVDQDGRFGFIMDKLEDITLLHRIQEHPEKALEYAKQMAEIHFQIHSVTPPEGSFLSQRDFYIQSIQSREGFTQEEKDKLCRRVEELSNSGRNSICHGDYHPLNLLFRGTEPVVLDWAYVTCGDPCADVAGTYLITKLLASTSAAQNSFERFIYDTFTPLFAAAYLKEYQRMSGMTRDDIKQWIPIRAATYTDLGLPERENQRLYKLAKSIR